MKKLFLVGLMVMVMVGFSGCAAMEKTMKKPALFIDFQYPLKDVWNESFKIFTSQGLIFEKGNIQEKYFFFHRILPIGDDPALGVYIVFKELNENKTRAEIHYNTDGILSFHKFEDDFKRLMDTINIGLMSKFGEERVKPYTIYDFEKWIDYHRRNETPLTLG